MKCPRPGYPRRIRRKTPAGCLFQEWDSGRPAALGAGADRFWPRNCLHPAVPGFGAAPVPGELPGPDVSFPHALPWPEYRNPAGAESIRFRWSHGYGRKSRRRVPCMLPTDGWRRRTGRSAGPGRRPTQSL